MRYRFIRAQSAQYPVTLMCRVLEVSQSGYYAWKSRGPSLRSQRDAERIQILKALQQTHRGTYGTRRMRAELQAQGHPCSRGQVRRLMKKEGLVCQIPKKYRCLTKQNPKNPTAPNLLNQDFSAPAPNTRWATDITEIRLMSGKKVYLAVMLDLFSRKAVSHSLKPHMRAELCLDVLKKACTTRTLCSSLIHHSDRGSQYTCHDYQEALEKSKRSVCW